MRSYLIHYLQGLLMGGSDIIPGVSGGTMALIVGIYERLIDTIDSLFRWALATVRFQMEEARTHWTGIEWRLIIPLGLGIGTAIVLAGSVILTLIEAFPEHTQALFFGLVAASIAIPWMRIDQPGWREAAIAAAFAIGAFLIVGLSTTTMEAPSLLQVFLSAAVAISAMILPGVSGAFLLKAMGLYESTLEALHGLASLDPYAIIYVATFCAGAGVGLGVFARFLNWLFATAHDATMAALVGLMLGALRALWPYLGEDGSTLLWPTETDPLWSVIGIGLIGFAFVIGLLRLSQRDVSSVEQ